MMHFGWSNGLPGMVTVLCFIFVLNFAVCFQGRVLSKSSKDYCVDDYFQKLFFSRDVSTRKWNYYHEEPPDDVNDISFRIVGGSDIDIVKAPYAVLYGYYCGGSLLAPEWVLTAAHCQVDFKFVSVGSSLSTEQKMYEVCQHYFHPNWKKPHKTNYFDWDFQLLLLESPVPVTSLTRPIAIGHDEDIVPGEYLTVSGWGYLTANKMEMSKNLQQVRVPVIPQDQCQMVDNKFYTNLTPRMFCAGYSEGRMDACQGDSGGPAVINNKLVGLVSFGIGCANGKYPGVYARVPMARPWLRKITGLNL